MKAIGYGTQNLGVTRPPGETSIGETLNMKANALEGSGVTLTGLDWFVCNVQALPFPESEIPRLIV
jgi:hypothetical protein